MSLYIDNLDDKCLFPTRSSCITNKNYCSASDAISSGITGPNVIYIFFYLKGHFLVFKLLQVKGKKKKRKMWVSLLTCKTFL